jgi:Protein of unknown function (DUF1566)/Repeat of unknown function (DUF5648)
MIYFNKSTLVSMLVVALLTACSGQSSTDTVSSGTATKAVQTTQATQTTSTSSSSSGLLASLAVAYPNGQLPAASVAQAAKELAQNPAALKLTEQSAPQTAPATQVAAESTSAPIQAQATSADYKAVTRIQNTTLTGAYFFTIYDTEQAAALAGNPNWKLEGAAFWASLATGTGLSPVHRFRNNINGSYLYTIYEAEKADIQANYASTFFYEGVAWYAQQSTGAGWSPLYRFRNLLNGTYLFSAYEAEKNAIMANYSAVFQLEGVAYYVRQDAPKYELVANGSGGFYDKTDCVKDVRTGLTWEGKPLTGLRAFTKVYTNYDSTTALQIEATTTPTYTYRAPTQLEVNAANNAIGFKNAVNVSNLCGSNAWRLPTKDELLAIAERTITFNAQGIGQYLDPVWFPVFPGSYYLDSSVTPWWFNYATSTPVNGYPHRTWAVCFNSSCSTAGAAASDTSQRSGFFSYSQQVPSKAFPIRLVHD